LMDSVGYQADPDQGNCLTLLKQLHG
jgi:hypothetical protein